MTDVKPDQSLCFELRWARAKDYGCMVTGTVAGDPFYASIWYHQGMADMAREFAAGQGAVLAKLDAIEKAIRESAPAQPVGEDS
jgi:hypothetical protein